MIIQSKLLSQFSEIRSGVSTKKGDISPEPNRILPDVGLAGNLSFKVGDNEENVRRNRERFFGELGIEINSLAFTRQVHGDTIRRADIPGQYDESDALMTNKAGVFLSVTVADCLPIFLYDATTHTIAAVHAGWRGSKLRILEKTIRVLSDEYGVKSKNLLAYIGPSAGICCYEVGEEVVVKFPEQFLERKNNSKPHLDLKEFNRNLLLNAGVKNSNVEISSYCTICNSKLFHSYRRDGKNSGRMMGVIGMAKKA